MNRRPALLLCPAVLATGLLAPAGGCQSTSRRLVPPLDPVRPAAWQPADTPLARPPSEPQTVVRASAEVPADPCPGDQARRPQNMLVLSGGGSYGAFSAGLLGGWGKTGRPEFDVVTGISTGALIAPLAFLGPRYDPELKRYYTEVRQKDIFVMRPLATVPFRDAAASAAPLRKVVEANITAELIGELAAEHRKGRRLYVGTTNLDARRFTTWDLGAIAARGGPDGRRLIVDILTASCAVPGVFPPVPIDILVGGKPFTEMHVDGGVLAPFFLPGEVLERAGPAEGVPPADVYVILAGKYYADPGSVKPRVLKVLGASAAAYYHGYARAELANMYHACKLAGVRFHAAAVRADLEVADTGIDFDPEAMSKLYAEGERVAAAGPKWDGIPPERWPGEGTPTRTGTRFRVK